MRARVVACVRREQWRVFPDRHTPPNLPPPRPSHSPPSTTMPRHHRGQQPVSTVVTRRIDLRCGSCPPTHPSLASGCRSPRHQPTDPGTETHGSGSPAAPEYVNPIRQGTTRDHRTDQPTRPVVGIRRQRHYRPITRPISDRVRHHLPDTDRVTASATPGLPPGNPREPPTQRGHLTLPITRRVARDRPERRTWIIFTQARRRQGKASERATGPKCLEQAHCSPQ